MKKSNLLSLIILMLSIFFVPVSFAWNHSIELGYGFSHDPNNTRYNNSGVLLSSDIIPLCRTPWTFWSVGASLGQWYTTAPKNKHLTTAAFPLALRYYPYTIANSYPTYLLGSVGPAFLSKMKFGKNTQGSNLAFQVNLGLGIEFNHWDVNLRYSHFSNAYLAKPDQGFTVLYLLSIGYLF